MGRAIDGAVLAGRGARPKMRLPSPETIGSLYDFDSLADSYDRWYQGPMGQMYDRLEKGAIADLLPKPEDGDRLLEVGCGTGHWSAFFAEKGFRVTGLDLSRPMLSAAREKKIPHAEFFQADAGAVPFPDNTFDVAAAITLLEFVPKPQRVLEEMVRCVRPGGRVIVGVLNRWSYLGLSRKLRAAPLFAVARFLSTAELKRLLSPYGPARVHSAACLFPWRWALGMGPLVDRVACSMRLPFGDFLAGEVSL